MYKIGCIPIKKVIHRCLLVAQPQQRLRKKCKVACGRDAVRQDVAAVKIAAEREVLFAAARAKMRIVPGASFGLMPW